jgi:rod shape-determining protein MreC
MIQSLIDQTGDYFNLREVNSNLRKDNTQLAYENHQLQDALLENIRLRKLLQFKYETNYELVPAKVIGWNPQDISSGLILSSKNIASVSKNSAVMTSQGLVGKIVKVTSDYAICQVLIDLNNRVSGRIQRNRQLGMVRSDGAIGLILDHVPNTIDVMKGDIVFTSGLSQNYPANIKIGVVNNVAEDDVTLFKLIEVIPSVNFDKLEEVFIYNKLDN